MSASNAAAKAHQHAPAPEIATQAGGGELRPGHPYVRIAVIAVFAGVYFALGMYFHMMLHTRVAFTHFAYIPIVLASMWWGRRGLAVAGIFAAETLLLRVFAESSYGAWEDAVRIIFFAAAALCVGWLSERASALRSALLVSERKHRMLADKSLSGILVYRGDHVLFVNRRLEEILERPSEELLGRSIWDFVHDADKPKVMGFVERRRQEGFTDLHYECRLLGRDGKAIWCDIASSVVLFEEEPAVLVNVYDITSRMEADDKRREVAELARKQEEQLIHSTRLAELGEMAAAVAHELNQPLTGIRNFARNAFYMIDKSAGSLEEVKSNLKAIAEQVDRASKIINQMRELTRRTERQFARLDLNGVLRESIEFIRPQLRLSQIELLMNLDENLPEIIGDRIRLEQVFLNLLTNARQAMEESTVRRLEVRTMCKPGNNCPVTVEIADTGTGFDEEVARRLFAPFFSTKKAGHGTGLGLSISMSIIKDHQGAIEARGMPGEGAVFIVRLPVERKEGAAEENGG